MSSENELSAEDRFRQAFARLKADTPKNLKPGTPVSQNNVAKEAGTTTSALRKSRFPSLVREIQAYVELHSNERTSKRNKQKAARESRRNFRGKLEDVRAQRDMAQSQLLSASVRIIELTEALADARRQLDKFQRRPNAFTK